MHKAHHKVWTGHTLLLQAPGSQPAGTLVARRYVTSVAQTMCLQTMKTGKSCGVRLRKGPSLLGNHLTRSITGRREGARELWRAYGESFIHIWKNFDGHVSQEFGRQCSWRRAMVSIHGSNGRAREFEHAFLDIPDPSESTFRNWIRVFCRQ